MVSTVNAAEIRRAARGILRASDALDDQIDTLLLAIQAIGEPCGEAEAIGALLGPSVISAVDTVVMSLATVEWLETEADNLEWMATSDALTESENIAA